ncbi:hypothetical protein SAMN05216553_108245 [Lentzea fradiae]|uniref:CAAX prenyl protease 2/Lysostaphin resistance protein A-like domain-containing protein n=1 Tax=Lentzea fradiae TaxID=200378 RepID=A0A1G7UJ81_9PSEU|nr:type II CAAX endopeptidase family protein [Lentzea fradiae]SDG47573.1 hypothetical protein SAMN05216553_108245 [Lentzea fradiae]
MQRSAARRVCAEPSGWERWVRRFRFPVLFVPLFAALLAVAEVASRLAPVPLLALPAGVGLAVAGLACYRWLARVVEGRDTVLEVAPRHRWAGLARGAALGAWLFCSVLALIGMLDGWGRVTWGSFSGVLGVAGVLAAVATMEEIVFRGVLFRMLEERAGTAVSVVVSSSLFGLAHLLNTGATPWTALSVGLTGGGVLAAAYVVTRSLWLPIGLHFGWNFAQAGVFGVELSGADVEPSGLLLLELDGPVVLTGGPFGPEASVPAVLVCLVATGVLLRQAARTARIRPRPRSS